MSYQHSQEIGPAVSMTLHLKGEPDVIYTPQVRETSMALEEDAPLGRQSFLSPRERDLAPSSPRSAEGLMNMNVKVIVSS